MWLPAPPPAVCADFLWVTRAQGVMPASLEWPFQAYRHEGGYWVAISGQWLTSGPHPSRRRWRNGEVAS